MFTKLLITIALNALTLYFVQLFIGADKFLIISTFTIFNTYIFAYICIGIVMGILNFIIKPILSLLSLPFVFLTFGLFLTFISMFMLYINEYLFTEIFAPDIFGITFIIKGGWITYLIASTMLSFLNSILHFIIRK
ncbi:TPA: phage holin family protein [Candidatus Gracilibacteria bacterium]|nr:phage holin family protein [Candidatus Gracilibacteria bacterium]